MAKNVNKLNEDIENIEEQLRSGDYKRLYIFTGDETYLKNYYKQMIIDEALLDTEKDMNLEIITKDSYDKSKIKDIIETAPFFSAYRIIILDEINISNKEELNGILNNIPDESIVIVLESNAKEDGDKKVTLSKLTGNSKKSVCKINFDKATDEILNRKMTEIAKKNNVKINKINMQYLVTRVGTDMHDITNEMEKLSSYVEEKGEITKDDIDLLCSIKLEEKVFDMISDLASGKVASAIRRYKAMIAGGEDAKAILGLIEWQYMLVYECKIALEQNRAAFEVVKALELKSDYPVKKSMEIAKKMSHDKIREILILANETDKGFIKGENNLEFLLYKIME